MLDLIPLHHVVLLKALLCSYELNTLDACWIAVDVWSNSSRRRIVSVYLTRTWCLYTWSCLDNLIIIRFSINCSTVICSSTVIISILREASSETYGPWVYFPTYKFLIYNFSFLFSFFAIFYFPFNKLKIPKILLYHLSFSIRSHVANNREWIDNPFIALGASWCLFVQVFGGLCVVSYWIDTLVLKN